MRRLHYLQGSKSSNKLIEVIKVNQVYFECTTTQRRKDWHEDNKIIELSMLRRNQAVKHCMLKHL